MSEYLKTQKAGGDFLGITQPGFRHLLSLDDFPKKVEGKGWPAEEVKEWYHSHVADDKPDFQKDRARKMKAEADKLELQVQQQRSELIELATVEREWTTRLSKLFTNLEKGYTTLAPKLSGLDAAAILAKLREHLRKTRERSAV